MTAEEQAAVCRAIAIMCMWGQGGIASCIIEQLDKGAPMQPSWQAVFRGGAQKWKRELVGVITDEVDLTFWIGRGYRLCNYTPEGMDLHMPTGGLHKYVSAELAAKYGPTHDSHNFRVYQARKEDGR